MNGNQSMSVAASDATAVDENALVNALRQGEEWAFETMVRVYGGRLFAVARRICSNEDDARDVLQSAYLSAFRALANFEGSCQLSTWLHRIVVNAALMRLRVRRRKPEDSIEALLPAFLEDGHHVEEFAEWSMPADRLLEREDLRATVRDCIARLPDQYRHRRTVHRRGRPAPRHHTDGDQGAAASRPAGPLDTATA